MNLLLFSGAAALMQVLFADPYLTDNRTLIYQNRDRRGLIWKTPWWMVCAWILAIFLLGMIYSRLQVFGQISGVGVMIFVAAGFFIFMFIEVLVNNRLPHLWHRTNCRQTMRVAHYALIAEFLMIVTLCPFFETLFDPGMTFLGAIGLGIFAGLIASLIFATMCVIYFNHKP